MEGQAQVELRYPYRVSRMFSGVLSSASLLENVGQVLFWLKKVVRGRSE